LVYFTVASKKSSSAGHSGGTMVSTKDDNKGTEGTATTTANGKI
jgi:hypothetical protein